MGAYLPAAAPDALGIALPPRDVNGGHAFRMAAAGDRARARSAPAWLEAAMTRWSGVSLSCVWHSCIELPNIECTTMAEIVTMAVLSQQRRAAQERSLPPPSSRAANNLNLASAASNASGAHARYE